jgi:hypothetical protein
MRVNGECRIQTVPRDMFLWGEEIKNESDCRAGNAGPPMAKNFKGNGGSYP